MTDDVSHDTVTYAVRGEGVTWRETGGEVVILDEDASVYFGLNASGVHLWRLLTTGASRASLVAALMSRSPVDEVRARTDVDALLAALDTYRLLERR